MPAQYKKYTKDNNTHKTTTTIHTVNQQQLHKINLKLATTHTRQINQFNIQQLYALPTLYLCVLCLSENKQRLVPLIA